MKRLLAEQRAAAELREWWRAFARGIGDAVGVYRIDCERMERRKCRK